MIRPSEDGPTALDRLHAEAVAADTAPVWARFYQALGATRLVAATEGPAGETVRLAEVAAPGGPTVLAYDRIERLAGHLDQPGGYAELPGIDLARGLAAAGVSLTLNLGAASEVVLDPARLDWLVTHFGADVDRAPEAGVRVGPPGNPPPDLVVVLGESIGALGRDCPEAWLVTLSGAAGDELVLVLGLAGDAERMEADIAEALTRAGQATTDRRFAVACPGRGSTLMAAARKSGIGIGG